MLIEDDNENENVLEKIERLLSMNTETYRQSQQLVAEVDEDMARLVRMFHLRMKVEGHVKELRDDYFH